MSASGTHNPPEFKHAADMEWEIGRFGNVTKFLFHPRPGRPTEPNAGFLKYAPDASISGASARVRANLVHHRGRIHFRREASRPWHDRLYARPALRTGNAHGNRRDHL